MEEMEPVGPTAKKMKLAASSVHATVAGVEEELLDRISNLPDSVLGEIISLLPTREGARTQALASRWRHLWCAAPLNLDYLGLPGGRDRQDALLGVILSAHQGPGRRLRLPAPRLQYRADAADAWLRSPALDNLQELDLYLAYSACSQPLASPPAPTFRFSSTLRVLTVSQCHLPDNIIDTLRFPQLRKLALVAVRISERSLHTIIAAAACPVLESLLLNAFFGVRRLRINSPTLLSIGIRSSSSSSGELIIDDAPSLQRLVHFGTHLKMQVTVVSAPKLETLGYISEYFGQSKIVFGSTVIQVAMFVLLLAFSTRLLISCIFMCREVISCVLVSILMFCSMLDKGIAHC